MKIVRRPRVSTEFEKMMRSNDPVKLLKMMKEIGVIFKVLPELCHLYRLRDHSRREELGPNAPLPTLWDVTLEKLAEVVGSDHDSLEARFAALFSQFHRVRLPYSFSDRNGEKSEKEKRRGRGRNAVVTTALRRLMYDYDFIRRVKALLPPNEGGEAPARTSKTKKKKRGVKEASTSRPVKKKKRRNRGKKKHNEGE